MAVSTTVTILISLYSLLTFIWRLTTITTDMLKIPSESECHLRGRVWKEEMKGKTESRA